MKESLRASERFFVTDVMQHLKNMMTWDNGYKYPGLGMTHLRLMLEPVLNWFHGKHPKNLCCHFKWNGKALPMSPNSKVLQTSKVQAEQSLHRCWSWLWKPLKPQISSSDTAVIPSPFEFMSTAQDNVRVVVFFLKLVMVKTSRKQRA